MLLGGLDEAISAQVNQRTSYIPDEFFGARAWPAQPLLPRPAAAKSGSTCRSSTLPSVVPLPELTIKSLTEPLKSREWVPDSVPKSLLSVKPLRTQMLIAFGAELRFCAPD